MDEHTVPPSLPPPLPPGLPPPLPAGPAPLPRRVRRANGWRIAVVVLGVLLLLSLLAHVGVIISSIFERLGTVSYGDPVRLQETVLEANHSAHKIAVIPIEGLIFSGSMDGSGYGLVRHVEEQLKMARRDARVKAVMLRINSPGGEVLASDEISKAIARFQTLSGKPVVAAMGSVAASGGYYVAAPCRWIVANELTITGSIGVMMHSYNYRGLLNKVGVRPLVFKSGRFKDMLSGDRDLEQLSAAERDTVRLEEQMIQRLIDRTFARFKTVVAEGRRASANLNRNNLSDKGRPLADNWEAFAEGQVWSGVEAYEHGFVDELGNWRTAVQRARILAGIGDANLVQYQQPFDLSNLFRILGRAEGPSFKVDMGLDMPRLQPGRLYFLAPTYAH
ncbi:MAG: signal peptide peptidase SppA [Verrucomicrobia bacterium]|nr:signal peptide peptidase SppA [Verrucomicrobiota bacterium]